MNEEMKKRVEETIKQSRIFLMMKGSPDFPQCGFSKRVADILLNKGVTFSHFNVFDDEELMNAIKEYANWPTTPQLWVDGKFIGGCDIVESLNESGELDKILEEKKE